MTYDPSLYTKDIAIDAKDASQDALIAALLIGSGSQQHITGTTTLSSNASSIVTLGMASSATYTVTLPNASSVTGRAFDFKRNATDYSTFGFAASSASSGRVVQLAQYASNGDYYVGTNSNLVQVFSNHASTAEVVLTGSGGNVAIVWGTVGSYVGVQVDNGLSSVLKFIQGTTVTNTFGQGSDSNYCGSIDGTKFVRCGFLDSTGNNVGLKYYDAGLSLHNVVLVDSASSNLFNYVAADANQIYTSAGSELIVWDFDGNIRRRLPSPEIAQSSLAVSSQGKLFVHCRTGSTPGKLYMVDTISGTSTLLYSTGINNVGPWVQSSADGSLIVSYYNSGSTRRIYIHDALGNLLQQLNSPINVEAAAAKGTSLNYELGVTDGTPPGSGDNQNYFYTQETGTGNVIIAPPGGQTIDGQSSVTLSAHYSSVRLAATNENGSYNWRILNTYL